jgi:hypothetical protein
MVYFTVQYKRANPLSSSLDALRLVILPRLLELLSEQLLGVDPNGRSGPLGQLQQRRQQVLGELLGGLSRKLVVSSCHRPFDSATYKGGEVVNRDDGASLSNALGVDLDGGLGEGGVDVVNGDRVVRVGSACRQPFQL